MGAPVVGRLQRALGKVADRKIRDRIASGLEQDDGVVATHGGSPAEFGAHPAPEGLGIQHALRHAGDQEMSVGVAAQWPLLP